MSKDEKLVLEVGGVVTLDVMLELAWKDKKALLWMPDENRFENIPYMEPS